MVSYFVIKDSIPERYYRSKKELICYSLTFTSLRNTDGASNRPMSLYLVFKLLTDCYYQMN
jgi:hypothetical protein